MSSLKEVLENTEKVKTENGTFFRLHDKVDQLEAENAKLRKLLGKYHYTLLALQDDEEEEGNHSPCPLYVCPDTTMCPWENEPCPFVKAIKELGIEADG